MVFIGWNDLGDKTPPTDTGALLVKWGEPIRFASRLTTRA